MLEVRKYCPTLLGVRHSGQRGKNRLSERSVDPYDRQRATPDGGGRSDDRGQLVHDSGVDWSDAGRGMIATRLKKPSPRDSVVTSASSCSAR